MNEKKLKKSDIFLFFIKKHEEAHVKSVMKTNKKE